VPESESLSETWRRIRRSTGKEKRKLASKLRCQLEIALRDNKAEVRKHADFALGLLESEMRNV
jgi:hypothetical protein